jgi:low molecular weight protein-tyrosine phosphatase
MPPFTVLQVCMGNICRSPMAERLLAAEADDDELFVHSAGTGGWHEGQPMDRGAAKQVLARGGDIGGFRARKLRGEHIDASDLILTATAEQADFVASLRPDAASRTFVLGEFGRLLASIDVGELPATSVYDRGVALVEAVERARGGKPPEVDDDLGDPWGQSDRVFGRIADEIEATVKPLAAALFGRAT